MNAAPRRSTVCFQCGRQLEPGVKPARLGVCPGEEVFTMQYEAWIREWNLKLDAGDERAASPSRPPADRPVEIGGAR